MDFTTYLLLIGGCLSVWGMACLAWGFWLRKALAETEAALAAAFEREEQMRCVIEELQDALGSARVRELRAGSADEEAPGDGATPCDCGECITERRIGAAKLINPTVAE